MHFKSIDLKVKFCSTFLQLSWQPHSQAVTGRRDTLGRRLLSVLPWNVTLFLIGYLYVDILIHAHIVCTEYFWLDKGSFHFFVNPNNTATSVSPLTEPDFAWKIR